MDCVKILFVHILIDSFRSLTTLLFFSALNATIFFVLFLTIVCVCVSCLLECSFFISFRGIAVSFYVHLCDVPDKNRKNFCSFSSPLFYHHQRSLEWSERLKQNFWRQKNKLFKINSLGLLSEGEIQNPSTNQLCVSEMLQQTTNQISVEYRYLSQQIF